MWVVVHIQRKPLRASGTVVLDFSCVNQEFLKQVNPATKYMFYGQSVVSRRFSYLRTINSALCSERMLNMNAKPMGGLATIH